MGTPALTNEERRTTYQLVYQLMLVDRRLERVEVSFLQALQHWLELTDDDRTAIQERLSEEVDPLRLANSLSVDTRRLVLELLLEAAWVDASLNRADAKHIFLAMADLLIHE